MVSLTFKLLVAESFLMRQSYWVEHEIVERWKRYAAKSTRPRVDVARWHRVLTRSCSATALLAQIGLLER